MPAFRLPSWATTPTRTASLVRDGVSTPVDLQPAYVFGTEPGVDVPLDPAAGAAPSHAALVHHANGRAYVIDLESARGPGGTFLDGHRLEPNKPTSVKPGARLAFGSAGARPFTFDGEAGGTKRGREMSGDAVAPPLRSGTVRASHLLVKHRDSRRPASWKEERVTRTREEALAMILAYREQLTAGGADFAALAATESHCSSAKRGGDLGPFGPGAMQKAFEDAVYGLQVGELSGPVESDSGVHLILRTE